MAKVPIGGFLAYHVLVGIWAGLEQWLRLGSMSAWWYVAAPVVIPLVSIKALPALLALQAAVHLFEGRAPRPVVILPAVGTAILVTALWWVTPLVWNVIVFTLLMMN